MQDSANPLLAWSRNLFNSKITTPQTSPWYPTPTAWWQVGHKGISNIQLKNRKIFFGNFEV